jgi:PadR family transcriptional regulator, regulatory protein PadR
MPDDKTGLLQGTLDMMVLRTLLFGPQHGHGIAVAIEQATDDVLHIDHGSLYPALHRLMQRGWITARWGTTSNNRRARFYRLTPAGKRHLTAEASRWERVTRAVAQVMKMAPQTGK